jgi:hypothetical protein
MPNSSLTNSSANATIVKQLLGLRNKLNMSEFILSKLYPNSTNFSFSFASNKSGGNQRFRPVNNITQLLANFSQTFPSNLFNSIQSLMNQTGALKSQNTSQSILNVTNGSSGAKKMKGTGPFGLYDSVFLVKIVSYEQSNITNPGLFVGYDYRNSTMKPFLKLVYLQQMVNDISFELIFCFLI